jgi:hypothetical protein
MLRPPRFGLRLLFVFQALIAVFLCSGALEFQRIRARRAALETILSAGGEVTFDLERAQPWRPGRWLSRFVGRDVAAPAAAIDLGNYFRNQLQRDIQWLKAKGSGPTEVGERELRAVIAFPELRRLCLSGAALNDRQVATIAALSGLEYLDLAGASIGDGALAQLAPLERLRFLNLSGTNVTDAGLRHLQALRALTSLVLGAWSDGETEIPLSVPIRESNVIILFTEQRFSGPARITDRGLAELAALPRLERLDLRDTDTSDQGLRHLVALPSLRSLNLMGMLVTDAGLAEVGRMTQLRLLRLSSFTVPSREALVSIDGVERLRGDLPGLQVEFDYHPGAIRIESPLTTPQVLPKP